MKSHPSALKRRQAVYGASAALWGDIRCAGPQRSTRLSHRSMERREEAAEAREQDSYLRYHEMGLTCDMFDVLPCCSFPLVRDEWVHSYFALASRAYQMTRPPAPADSRRSTPSTKIFKNLSSTASRWSSLQVEVDGGGMDGST